jgi:hypothetical protein
MHNTFFRNSGLSVMNEYSQYIVVASKMFVCWLNYVERMTA